MNTTVRKEVEVEVAITPKELGMLFTEASDFDQAIFLETVESLSSEWARPADFQWCYMAIKVSPQARHKVLHMLEQWVDNLRRMP